jgi:hypothetical protein
MKQTFNHASVHSEKRFFLNPLCKSPSEKSAYARHHRDVRSQSCGLQQGSIRCTALYVLVQMGQGVARPSKCDYISNQKFAIRSPMSLDSGNLAGTDYSLISPERRPYYVASQQRSSGWRKFQDEFE